MWVKWLPDRAKGILIGILISFIRPEEECSAAKWRETFSGSSCSYLRSWSPARRFKRLVVTRGQRWNSESAEKLSINKTDFSCGPKQRWCCKNKHESVRLLESSFISFPPRLQTSFLFTASAWQKQPRDEERGANSGKYIHVGRWCNALLCNAPDIEPTIILHLGSRGR